MKYKGGLIDDRKVNKDYSNLEVGKSSIPTYLTRAKAKKVETLYVKRSQKQTSSCGGHAGELAVSIDNGGEFEPAFLYRLRRNFAGEGMYHYDIGDILNKTGICKDKKITKTEKDYNQYFPSQTDYTNAKQVSGKSYIVMQDNKFDIDDIAYVLNDLKLPLILFVYWNGSEWSSSEPKADGNLEMTQAQYHHFVTALPNSAYIYRGKKYFIIQDSSPFGGKHIRHISVDWVNKRIYTGLYQFDLEYQKDHIDKKVKFDRDLTLGDTGKDVKLLQETLKSLGYFPNNIRSLRLLLLVP